MFIELTTDGRKHLFPLSSITVHQLSNGKAAVQVIGGKELAVDESYEDIIKRIKLLYKNNGKVWVMMRA